MPLACAPSARESPVKTPTSPKKLPVADWLTSWELPSARCFVKNRFLVCECQRCDLANGSLALACRTDALNEWVCSFSFMGIR